MAKPRRKIDGPRQAAEQRSLFDYIRTINDVRRETRSNEGSMNVDDLLRRSLNRAIKRCPLSRPQIAGEMSHLLGVDITKAMIDAWTAESKDNYRIPASYLPAFCQVTGSTEPIEILSDAAGMYSMPGPDALRAEIQRFAEAEKQARSEKRKRETFLAEMEGNTGNR